MSPEPFTPAPPTPPVGHDERDPFVGTVLDERYFIDSLIASGGFGAVYRAHIAHGQRAGEPVAIKILHPHMTSDPRMVVRFRREGATLTSLHDPHTVTVYALGEARDGTLYIVMELLRGESVFDRLQRLGAIPWRDAAMIARAVCSSLAEAHQVGIIHRDLKPANIHIEESGVVKVIDFGIAKIVRGSSIDDGLELTFAGHMIGTYDYMSPEQIVGGTCVAQSDIFSLGVVVYEMLTGRRPFEEADNPQAMMQALLNKLPTPPSKVVTIPPDFERLLLRCLSREIADRPADIAKVATALEDILTADLHEAETVMRPVVLAELETTNERVLSGAALAELADTTVRVPRVEAVPTAETLAPPDAETVIDGQAFDPADEPTVRPAALKITPLDPPTQPRAPVEPRAWRRPDTLPGTPAPRVRNPRGTPALPQPEEVQQRYPTAPVDWREPISEPPAPLSAFPAGSVVEAPVRTRKLYWTLAILTLLVIAALGAGLLYYFDYYY